MAINLGFVSQYEILSFVPSGDNSVVAPVHLIIVNALISVGREMAFSLLTYRSLYLHVSYSSCWMNIRMSMIETSSPNVRPSTESLINVPSSKMPKLAVHLFDGRRVPLQQSNPRRILLAALGQVISTNDQDDMMLRLNLSVARSRIVALLHVGPDLVVQLCAGDV